MIARQKEDLSISYNVEANLRLQLTRIQDRAVTMQREINQMRDLLGLLYLLVLICLFWSFFKHKLEKMRKRLGSKGKKSGF